MGSNAWPVIGIVWHMGLVAAVSLSLLACGEASNLGEATNLASEESVYRPLVATSLPEAETSWAGRRWRVNAGSVADPKLTYAVQIDPTGTKARFELRDSDADRSVNDPARKRRAELSGSLYGEDERLPNGEALRGAFTFNHHSWSDPEAMRALTGGVYGQIHMGSEFGGSPALAFRRRKDGQFLITTRGEYDTQGQIVYAAPLSFDEPHRLEYEVTLHPRRGSLQVWLDGQRVVERQNLSIGHSSAQSYWSIGLYFSGGIAGSVSAQYSDHVYPGGATPG